MTLHELTGAGCTERLSEHKAISSIPHGRQRSGCGIPVPSLLPSIPADRMLHPAGEQERFWLALGSKLNARLNSREWAILRGDVCNPSDASG